MWDILISLFSVSQCFMSLGWGLQKSQVIYICMCDSSSLPITFSTKSSAFRFIHNMCLGVSISTVVIPLGSIWDTYLPRRSWVHEMGTLWVNQSLHRISESLFPWLGIRSNESWEVKRSDIALKNNFFSLCFHCHYYYLKKSFQGFLRKTTSLKN